MIISFFQRKGGVGKTTAAVSTAAILAENGEKVLLIDLDSQRNASRSMELKEEPKYTIADVLMDQIDIKKSITNSIYDNLDLIVADKELNDIENDLFKKFRREEILKNALKKIEKNYDFIILDLPASFNIFTINALTASNYLAIPVLPDRYCLEGLVELIEFKDLIKGSVNPDLKELGVFFNIADARTSVAKNYIRDIQEVYPVVFDTIIRKNETIKKAQDASVPINFFDKTANAYEDYVNFVKEIKNKIKEAV